MTEERRKRVLSDEDIQAFAEVITRSRPVPDSLHLEHHEFIAQWIERTKRRAALAEKVKAQVGGWFVISLLAGIGYAVWEWVRNHIR